MRNVAFVYAGRGTSERCVRGLERSVQQLVGRYGLLCRRLDARAMNRGDWRHRAALVCVPGGRDLPYTQDLSNGGLAHLRQYVAAGGLYVGSCAGAYFACRHLSFRAARVPAIEGRRALGLLAAVAAGPSQAADAFAYGTGPGAGERRLALCATASLPERVARQWLVFNQGGCTLRPLGGVWRRHEHVLLQVAPDADDVAPEARAQAVAVQAAYGRGRVLLVGAHPELTPSVAAQSPASAACRGPQAMAALIARALGAR